MSIVSAIAGRVAAACATALVATLSLSLPCAAADPQAVPATAGSSGPVSAAERFALLRATLFRSSPSATHAGQATQARQALPATDANPPQLRAIDADSTVSTSADIPQLKISVDATDDNSGVYYVILVATGPNGQTKVGQIGPEFPTRHLNDALALQFSRNDAPGLWRITDLEVGDQAGNWHDYSAPQLARLGSTSFRVFNSFAKYLDDTPPTLAGGTVLNAVIPLSQYTAPLRAPVGIELHMTDAGNPAPTGVASVDVFFCLLDGTTCIEVQQFDSVQTRTKTILTPATTITNGEYPPGDYYLYYVHMFDHGGNEQYVVGTEFNGTTDFSRLFPAGHKITLLP